METKFKRNLIINSSISLLILCVSSTASFLSIKSLLSSNWWVSHTYEVIYNLNSIESQMTAAQNSVRGFLVTGKENFLEQYTVGEKQSSFYFDKVKYLTSDNDRQQQNLKELQPLKTKFYLYLNSRIQSKKNGSPVLDRDLDQGKVLMDQVSLLMKLMVEEEKRLLLIRTSDSSKYSTFSLALIIIAAFLAIFITVAFFIKMLKDNNIRIQLYRELQTNEKETLQRIKVIGGIAQEISKGNYDIQINHQESDILGNIAVSLNEMAKSLHISFSLLSDKEWLQSGVAGLNKVMIGDKNTKALAYDITEYVASYTASSAGVLYIAEGEELFSTAGYSYIPRKENERFLFGSGLTGQAAVSRKILELKPLSNDDITISYALGEIKPSHVIAIPLIDIDIVGVIELASIHNYSQKEIEFLNTVAHNIAVAITAAQNKAKLQVLLEETQAQSEELMVQHTELESVNAELEAQSEKLQASDEELRVQQEELQQTNNELSQRGLLLEEKNDEIQKKSEALELSTRYKSEFLANMSHELRTPLNSILLLSRLLEENNDTNMNEEQIEFAKVIRSSGNGLLTLIDEILDLSKIESGKMELEIEDVSIKDISENLKNLFGEVAKHKNLKFDIIEKDAPFLIKTDRTRLEQILKNFISNALKFTEEGSVVLEITSASDQKNTVIFKVKDTGIGIAKEKQSLVFEAFQQADGSTKRKYGGTGLGLSISRELAKLLNGTISIQSEIGTGSEFMLTIPVVASDITILDKINPLAVPDNFAVSDEPYSEKYLTSIIPVEIEDDRNNILNFQKLILIIEDDTKFAKTLLDYTRKKGYSGIVCVQGDLAVDFAIKYKPAGILLDIELPVLNGWQVLEALKSNTQTRHIPVHIMSSHKVKHKSMLNGAVHFLEKPVAYEQLPDIFTRIEKIINRESHKVLIIEDNSQHARALCDYLKIYNINSSIKSEITEGIDALLENDLDCVILDMGIPYGSAYELLDSVKKNPGMENLPIIVFTGQSLSLTEEAKIKKYADSIIIKTAHSYQRMLDEVSLFLHLMDNQKTGKGEKKFRLPDDILQDKKVLVVDDDIRNIYSLTKVLEELKMNVVTAIDGEEALKVLEEYNDIDIILLDMMMPNMDGYETSAVIRKNQKYKNLPIIAVTAKAMTGDREKCIKAGASDYVTKPVDPDQLASLLRVWLYDKI